MIAIIGASGLVGWQLYTSIRQIKTDLARLTLDAQPVIGTYRTTTPDLIHFDINKMSLRDLDIDWHRVTHLVIAVASNTKLDQVRME